MNTDKNLEVDWLAWFKDPLPLKTMMANYKAENGLQGPIFLPEYQKLTDHAAFLVPSYIMWRKKVDAPDLLESQSVSDKRKKLIRKALSKSEQIGVAYKLVNPVMEADFARFLSYYTSFCNEMKYEMLLKASYFTRHLPEHLFLIEVWRGDEYLGARLICRYKNNLSTDYRAIARTREVKEGYDIICEKIYFDLAARLGVPLLGRGKELNCRGIGGKSIGMLWNKLKYGYKPVVTCYIPRIYSDYGFLKDIKFDLFFFVSIENDPDLWVGGEEVLVLNFVCGDHPSWDDIRAVKEKSPYQVKMWDRDFNLIEV